MNHPEIPEELKGTAKAALDVVFAAGPDGERYEIPLAVARQHMSTSDHPAVLSAADLQEDEVAGHHRVLLQDGTYGYHSDWLVGPYIWHRDGGCYNGLHRHPWGKYDARAIDMDDL